MGHGDADAVCEYVRDNGVFLDNGQFSISIDSTRLAELLRTWEANEYSRRALRTALGLPAVSIGAIRTSASALGVEAIYNSARDKHRQAGANENDAHLLAIFEVYLHGVAATGRTPVREPLAYDDWLAHKAAVARVSSQGGER